MSPAKKTRKTKKSIVRRLVTVVLIGMILINFSALAVSAFCGYHTCEDVYNEKTMQLANMAANSVNAEYIKLLYEEVSTPEYREIYDRSQETGDTAEIEQWLRDKDLHEGVDDVANVLNFYCESMGTQYLYIQAIEDGTCVTLIDPSDLYVNLGAREELGEGFTDIKGNEKVEPRNSITDYGWLSSGGMPILDENGEAVAVAFCDYDMTYVLTRSVIMVFADLMFCFVIMIILGFIMGVFVKRHVAAPIVKLSDAVTEFGTDEASYDREKIVSLDIHTKDEVEMLYDNIRQMQGSIIDYMENLTAVTAEKERIGAELDVANRIQASMLPNVFPAFPDRKEFDIYASMTPAKEVGGDFYNFFLIDEDHLGLVIADVSGKGVPAALFMMMSMIIITNYAQMGLSPSEVLRRANDRICEGNEEDMFVTVWFGIMTISTGHVVAANAGHEYPMLRKADGDFELFEDEHDLVIGAMEDMDFREYEFDIEAGGTLFVYTDGCPEATNADNQLFELDRMLGALNEVKDGTPEEILKHMSASVDAFVGEAPQFDDLTMLAVKRSI